MKNIAIAAGIAYVAFAATFLYLIIRLLWLGVSYLESLL